MTDRPNDQTTNLRVDEYRKQQKERMELLRRGDISMALSSVTMLWNTYQQMGQDIRNALNEWSDTVRLERENANQSVRLIEKFNKNAEKLLGDSLRVVLKECSVKPEEITEIADDNGFTALLERIASADIMSAMKITQNAYTVAVKTLGSYTSKIIGLKNKSIENGASSSEANTADAMIRKLNRIVDVVKHRKNVLVELNLKYKGELAKFAEKNTINPSKDRNLTEEEKEILKGLI